MTVLDSLVRSYRVNSSVYEDESVNAGPDGINTGSPTTSTGDGGEDFLEYNGTTQSTAITYPSSEIHDGTSRTIAVRFRTTTTLGTSDVIAGFGSSSDNDPAFVIRGSGANSIQAWIRNDDTSMTKTAVTGVNANLYDDTERIAVATYNYTTDTLTIKELTLSLSGTATSQARSGTVTIDGLGVANWPRSSPTWQAPVDTSWVAVWDKVLTAQDETDLAAAPWPFVSGPTITAPTTISDGVATTITGTDLATVTSGSLDVSGSNYLVDQTSNMTLGGATIPWTPETNQFSTSALPTVPFTDPTLHTGASNPVVRLGVTDGVTPAYLNVSNPTPAGWQSHMWNVVSGMDTTNTGAVAYSGYIANPVIDMQFYTQTTVDGVTLVFDDNGNWSMDSTSYANLIAAGSVDFTYLYIMPDTGDVSGFILTISATSGGGITSKITIGIGIGIGV